MKKISLRNDLDAISIYKNQIEDFLKKIDEMSITDTNAVTVDLKGHYTDYQVTPHIIGHFLKILSTVEGKKTFTILHSGTGSKKELMLYDLVFDNDFFSIKYKPSEEKVDEYENKINEILKENNIKMEIICEFEKKKYTYG